MSEDYEVIVAVKDPGGTNGLLPVVEELIKREVKVLLVANGKSIQMIPKDTPDYIPWTEKDDKARLLNFKPKILLSSMCSSYGGIGQELVADFQNTTTVTIVVEDYWGGSTKLWSEDRFQPNFFCVNDRIGKSIAFNTWPKINDEDIKITGWPAFDKYYNFDVKEEACKFRNSLGLDQDKPLIFLAGGGESTGHLLEEVTVVLNKINRDAYLIARPHPRTKENFSEIIPQWNSAMAKLNGVLPIFDFFGEITSPAPLLAASQVVISAFGTLLVEAAALHQSGLISVFYPEEEAEYRKSIHYEGDFPLAELGCCYIAKNRSALEECIIKSLNGAQDLQSQQKECFKLDGNNAKRVADLVCSQL